MAKIALYGGVHELDPTLYTRLCEVLRLYGDGIGRQYASTLVKVIPGVGDCYASQTECVFGVVLSDEIRTLLCRAAADKTVVLWLDEQRRFSIFRQQPPPENIIAALPVAIAAADASANALAAAIDEMSAASVNALAAAMEAM